MDFYTVTDLKKHFGTTTYTRGLGYQNGGRVGIITKQDNVISAKVKGTSKSYTTRVSIIEPTPSHSRYRFKTQCSCPIGSDCKHAVALLLSYHTNKLTHVGKDIFDNILERLGVDFATESLSPTASPQKTAPRMMPEKAPELDWEARQWLQSMVKLGDIAPEEEPRKTAHSAKAVAYIIAPPKRPGTVYHLAIAVTGRQKDGTLVMQRSGIQFEEFRRANTAGYVTEADKEIAEVIKGIFTYSSQGGEYHVPVNPFARLLLDSLVATNRLYFSRVGNDYGPLRLGAPLPAEITWHTRSDGRQSVRLMINNLEGEAHALPLSPPCYLRQDTLEVGILETGLQPHQAAMLLQAPPIAATQVEQVAGALRQRFHNTAILPKVLERVKDVRIPPTPVLRLSSQSISETELDKWGYRRRLPSTEIAVAALSFDYAGQRVAHGSKEKNLTAVQDDKVLEILRDPVAEGRAVKALTKQNMTLQLNDLRRAYYDFDQKANEFFTFGLLKPALARQPIYHQEWMEFVTLGLSALKAQGWKVETDSDFPFNLVMVDDESWEAKIEEGSGIDWFGLELGVSVNGEKFNLMPILLNLLKHGQRLLPEQPAPDAKKKTKKTATDENALILLPLPDGRKLGLPRARAETLLRLVEDLYRFNGVDKAGNLKLGGMDAALMAEMEAASQSLGLRWFGGEKLRGLGKKLREFAGIQECLPPKSFKASLRGYQQDGLNWLQFLREYELSGILADDMGLGKTVQALAHICTEKAAKRLKKPFLVVAPTSLMVNWRMEAERFAPHLKVVTLHGAERHERFADIKNADLVLTTYPLLTRDKAALLQHEFHTLILDEAQTIKNARAKLTQIVCQLKAEHRLCMTGTPLENHLGELWSLFNFLIPGYLGDEKTFRSLFRTPIEKLGDYASAQALNRRVKPFILRRTKAEVVTELPPKTEIIRMIELEGGQRDLYEAIRVSMDKKVRDEIAKRGLAKSHIIVLDALLKLRQACCDPRLLSLDAAAKVKESAKLEELMDMLVPMLEEGRKVLLFSQFTSMLALIEERLKAENIRYVQITGSTKDRETPVRVFQAGEVPLFLISLKAGGTGLNLTAADTVIHYDPWWNPAVENQATDRAYRIGQDKPVFVYKLVTSGSVEEKILEMQGKKQALADALFNPEVKSSGKLNPSDIATLFEPLGTPEKDTSPKKRKAA